MPARRLEGLDALRGIAALCVFQFHASFILGGATPEASGAGYLAVDFFFMLSGYVMARTYEQRLAKGFGAMRFLGARYRRLWPIMAIGGVITAPMLAMDLGDPATFAAIFVANLLFIPVFFTGTITFPLNSVAWSILAELFANAVHAVVLWRWRTRAVFALAAFCLPALAATAWYHGTLDLGAGVDNVWAGFLRALFAYAIGIVLYRKWRDEPPFRLSPLLAFAAMPALFAWSLWVGESSWLFDVAFVALVCPLLVGAGLAWQHSHWLARWLGLLSFPLYAVHLPMLQWGRGLHVEPVLTMAATIALALYIAWRNEAPKRGKSPRNQPAAAAEPVPTPRGLA